MAQRNQIVWSAASTRRFQSNACTGLVYCCHAGPSDVHFDQRSYHINGALLFASRRFLGTQRLQDTSTFFLGHMVCVRGLGGHELQLTDSV